MEIDRQTLSRYARQTATRRRLIWCLLRLDEGFDALEEAKALEAAQDGDSLADSVIHAAYEYSKLEAAPDRDALVAMLPAFRQREGSWVIRGYVNPEPRPWTRLETP